MRAKRSGFRFLLLFVLSTLLLAGCGKTENSTLDPAGPMAEELLFLINLSTGIMLLVMVVVFGIFFYVLFRYRERPGDTHIPEQVEGSVKLEVLWTVIPVLLLTCLAIPTVSTTLSQAKMPEDGEGLKVNVTAYQYWWAFEYPEEGIVTGQELHIPVGQKVHLTMTSEDVIHSFWVPRLAGKTDLNPGKTTEMMIEASEPGIYRGKCAELCGESHALMNFKVIAHEQEEFDKWLAQMKEPDSKPKTATAEEGAELFAQSCLSCHAIAGADFEQESGATAPDLTAFGTRTEIAGILEYNEENLKKWIKDPEKIKPGVNMPGFGHFSEQQLNALTEYLMNLK